MKNLPIKNIRDLNVSKNNKFRKELESLRVLVYKDENEHLIPVEEDFFRNFIRNHESLILSLYSKKPYCSSEDIAILFFTKFMKKEFSFSGKERINRLKSFTQLYTFLEPFLQYNDSLEFDTFRFSKNIYVEFLAGDLRDFLKKLQVKDKTIFSINQYLLKNKQKIKQFLSEEYYE